MQIWTEHTLNNFTDNTKLRGVTDTPGGCPALQKDLGLENSCGAQHQEMQGPASQSRHQCTPGATKLECSFAKKDLEVLLDSKLTTSQQRTFVAKKANSTLGCIRKSTVSRLREVILAVYTPLVRLYLQCVPSSELSSTRKKKKR